MTAVREIAALPSRVRVLLGASALNNLGSGLVLPLLVLYVTEGLGLDVRYSTTAIAVTSACAALGGPMFGWLVDRWGRMRALACALSVAAAGSVTFGLATGPVWIMFAAALLGLGVGGNSAWFTILAESVPDDQRPVVFGANMMAINVALGLGGVLGGLAVVAGGPGAVRWLYLCNACTFLASGLLTWWAGARRADAAPDHAGLSTAAVRPGRASTSGAGTGVGGYLDILRSPMTRGILLLALLAYAIGYSQLEIAVPAVLLGGADADAFGLSAAFAANTAAVVLGQLVLLGRLRQRSASANSVAFAALWTVAWLVLLASGAVGGSIVPVVLGCLCMVIFGLGECFYGVSLPTLVNREARDDNRGRVNGLYTLMTSVGFVVGPLGSGQVLATFGPSALAATLAGCGGLLVLALLVRIRRRRALAGAAGTPVPPQRQLEDA